MRRSQLGILSLSLAACFGIAHGATFDPARAAFKDSIREVSPAGAPATGQPRITRSALMASERAASITFEVALRMRNFDELQDRIAKGEQVSPAEKDEKYFPLAADHDKLVAWLKAQGLEVTRTDDNRLAVFGRGSVDAVAKAFQVTFARVASADGVEFTSAITSPSVPAEMSSAVLGIHGLQPHIRKRPLSAPHALRPNLSLTGYTPSQIATTYGAASLGMTGAGQTIAIYALGYPASSDLTSFWQSISSTQTVANVTHVDVGGGPETSPAADILEEASLDVEWAGALAPGAKIRVYAANDFDPAADDEILQQVYADALADPTIHVFSISIGGVEDDVPKDFLVMEGQYMANLASAGITVLVASGDDGATEENKVQTTYPTTDPDVTGVGGTTLTLSPAYAETAWTDSGGGISQVFKRPAWQVGNGVPNGTMRLVPDVASAADPQNGASFWYGGKSQIIGGTSWSAPTWAGFVALINQKTGTPLGMMNPKLYPLLGTSAFNDITTGNNGAYSAGVGYDLITGLGTPNVAVIAAAPLSASPAAGIPAQTGDQVVTTNQLATFYVVGSGTPLPTFQWQRMASGTSGYTSLTDGGNYSGSQTQMLVVSGTSSSMTGDKFQCVVTNTAGSVVSNPATLTVNQTGITTLAGWPGAAGSVDATGRAARFSFPGGVKVDGAGNLYVSDATNYTIRKVSPGGTVTTIAGVPGKSGATDGPAASALFAGPGGVALDSSGNIFVADSVNYTIREISTSGVVTTIAGLAGTSGHVDGTGTQAQFKDPENIAIDSSNNIYVADGSGNVIRKVTEAGVVTTIAGSGASGSADGTGISASFNDLTGIAVDSSGNVYVADNGNNEVRKMTPAGVVTTLAGSTTGGSAGGSGSAASFEGPAGLGVDSSGNVYVADSENNLIRKVDPTGFVTTIGGLVGDADSVDGITSNSRFDTPSDVAVDSSGIVFVADALNCTIRRIVTSTATTPFFTVQPTSMTATVGASVTMAAGTAGQEPLTFQWNFNGAAIAGATAPTYTIASVQLADAGTYTLTISNSSGSATSTAATLVVNAGTVMTPPPPSTSGRLTNISTRAFVGTGGNILIPGFHIAGSGSETLLVRAVGPTLATFSVTGVLAQPVLTVLDGTGVVIATNTGWGNSSDADALASTAQGVTFPLGQGAADSALLVTLQAGASYTVQVSGLNATSGVALAEIYEISYSGSARLSNISTRAEVGTGGNILIPGFVISGSGTEKLLVRADGPVLSTFNVAGVLARPDLEVLSGSSTVVASNIGWSTASDAAQIAAAAVGVTFAFPAGSADSAEIVSLAPGAYTVQVSGVNSTTGVALAEIYEIQ
ncbi:MAG TPA: protease pro-enzyme activation domain-containing protein [Opitutaceae bacterium]|nr:protease pro-enzyme activation domain-containing protein [Opitutaceae bacterium]